INEAQRANFAAAHILELLDIATSNVFTDPQRAAEALTSASAIDPSSSGFNAVSSIFESFHADMDSLRNFTPTAGGANIGQFLSDAQARLRPYTSDAADPRFQQM